MLADLQSLFEDLGLNGYQARVLLALLQLGSATGIDLARQSGVPRTSVYPVLNELSSKQLITPVPGKTTVWVSPGVDQVLDRLYTKRRQQFATLETRVDGAREALARLAPASTPVAPHVNVIHGAEESRLVFEQSLDSTENELLMFTRPPISWPQGAAHNGVLAALGRGVSARVLYQASDFDDPRWENWHTQLESYHSAGAKARVVDNLPAKLAIFDRRWLLLALSDHSLPDVGYPTALMIDHAGFAELQERAFEDLWAGGRTFDAFLKDRTRPSPTRTSKTRRPLEA